MKNKILIFVSILSHVIFTAEDSFKANDWQEHFRTKIRSEMTPEEKEAYQKQQSSLKAFRDRQNQPLPRKAVTPPDEKKVEDIEAALREKGFQTDFSQDEEREDEEQQRMYQKQRDEQKQKLLQKEEENKKISQDEGFIFPEDQTDFALDSNNIETWTPENISSVQPEFFKKLTTQDLKKLLQNQELVKKLSIDQVQAIDEKKLSEIIQRNVKNLFSSKNHQAIKFADEFVEKLSGDQINRLLEDHVGGFNGIGKNFSSYFSPEMRKNLDKRQAEYKNYGGKVADLMQEARLNVSNLKRKVYKLELSLPDQVRILKVIDPENYQAPAISIDESKNLQVRESNFLSKLKTLNPQKVALMDTDQIKEFLTIKKKSFEDKESYDYVQSFDPESFASAISSNIEGISDNKFITDPRLPKTIVDKLTFDQVAAIMQKTGGEYSKINSKIISQRDFEILKNTYFKGDLLDQYLKHAKKYGIAVAKAMIKDEAVYKSVLSNDQKKIVTSSTLRQQMFEL